MLNAIYETDFLGFSYGFHPGRSPHDALNALYAGIMTRKVSWCWVTGIPTATKNGQITDVNIEKQEPTLQLIQLKTYIELHLDYFNKIHSIPARGPIGIQ